MRQIVSRRSTHYHYDSAADHIEEDAATEKLLRVCINHLVQGNRLLVIFSVILHIKLKKNTAYVHDVHPIVHHSLSIWHHVMHVRSSVRQQLANPQCTSQSTRHGINDQKHKGRQCMLQHWPMLIFTNREQWSTTTRQWQSTELELKMVFHSNRSVKFRFSSVFQLFLFAKVQIMLAKCSIMLF